VLRTLSLCTCCRHYPGAAAGRDLRSRTQPYQPSPISLSVGLHVGFFETCSAFTHVAACTRARSPSRDRYPEASDISSPPRLLRLLPAGADAGWDLHSLENAALHGAPDTQPPIPTFVDRSDLAMSPRNSPRTGMNDRRSWFGCFTRLESPKIPLRFWGRRRPVLRPRSADSWTIFPQRSQQRRQDRDRAIGIALDQR
jgi:hypothetical protein